MLKDKARMIPKKGFNLVGVDDYQPPGSQLYLVGNYASRDEADKTMKSRQKTGNGDKMFVYGPDDH